MGFLFLSVFFKCIIFTREKKRRAHLKEPEFGHPFGHLIWLSIIYEAKLSLGGYAFALLLSLPLFYYWSQHALRTPSRLLGVVALFLGSCSPATSLMQRSSRGWIRGSAPGARLGGRQVSGSNSPSAPVRWASLPRPSEAERQWC